MSVTIVNMLNINLFPLLKQFFLLMNGNVGLGAVPSCLDQPASVMCVKFKMNFLILGNLEICCCVWYTPIAMLY